MKPSITQDLVKDGVHLGLGFESYELEEIKSRIGTYLRNRVGIYRDSYMVPLEDYHTVGLVPHREIFTMVNRVVPLAHALRKMSVLKKLEQEFGPFKISDDYKLGYENVLMRFVRPNELSDVGSFHCDRWFLDVMGFDGFEGHVPIKIWTAICCQPGESGLFLCPGSHKKKWTYSVQNLNGVNKPVFDEGQDYSPELYESNAGQCAVFGYDFLHGGSMTKGNKTRVSIEFTILIPEAVFARKIS
jgi:hypothetical protein